ncbi:DUF2634 domain-containing protein [Salimicrobium halophilum]|uniref:DUF2634 domain-containing protein n=1 Tax=Salimicrobium halophilum TaxID=86666 RepID=A0A1G8WD31_9BACI|nr:DUF2634 domain-containing protein [Salimicrobium halophilum]SDJ76123.1 Protein of unknown function [Salimicrobium halophilum]
MFPKVTKLEQVEMATQAYEEELTDHGHSYLFDFDLGDFVLRDGAPVKAEGKEAVKMWVEMAIRTQKNRYDAYEGSTFGVQTDDLRGHVYSREFVQTELQREIRETLTVHPAIESISNFSFERDGSLLRIAFTLNTIYGSEPMEVEG